MKTHGRMEVKHHSPPALSSGMKDACG